MRSRTGWMRAAVMATAIGAAMIAAAACAGPNASRPTTAAASHPQVDTGLDTCASCHGQVTPRAAAQWREGRHGMSLVECFVCHGSTGADFKAQPGTTGCRGCHPAESASVTQSCFACHAAHSLRAQGTTPHATPSTRGTR